MAKYCNKQEKKKTKTKTTTNQYDDKIQYPQKSLNNNETRKQGTPPQFLADIFSVLFRWLILFSFFYQIILIT